MSAVRRDKTTIIYEMLLSVINKGGAIKPTHMLYKSNLSYKRMLPLVDELSDKGLIRQEVDGKKKTYFITDEGRQFVFEFQKMKNFLDSFGF